MTLNYSRFRSTSSKFFSFVSNNARCFLNTLHVGSSINCGRKRNARRIRTELEKDTWLTAMKKSGGDVKRDRTKCRIEIQRTRKRDNTPDENTGNGGSNGTDPSNVCEKFYLFDHRHVYYFIPSNSYFSFENK